MDRLRRFHLTLICSRPRTASEKGHVVQNHAGLARSVDQRKGQRRVVLVLPGGPGHRGGGHEIRTTMLGGPARPRDDQFGVFELIEIDTGRIPPGFLHDPGADDAHAKAPRITFDVEDRNTGESLRDLDWIEVLPPRRHRVPIRCRPPSPQLPRAIVRQIRLLNVEAHSGRHVRIGRGDAARCVRTSRISLPHGRNHAPALFSGQADAATRHPCCFYTQEVRVPHRAWMKASTSSTTSG